MSRLDELIAKLCPDGVEHSKLYSRAYSSEETV